MVDLHARRNVTARIPPEKVKNTSAMLTKALRAVSEAQVICSGISYVYRDGKSYRVDLIRKVFSKPNAEGHSQKESHPPGRYISSMPERIISDIEVAQL